MSVIKNEAEIKELLDRRYEKFRPDLFIEYDPVSVPHRYKKRGDIEISAFLTSVISWGNRKSIIANASLIMKAMDNSPLDFTLNSTERDLNRLRNFVHRTFSGEDLMIYIRRLKQIYIENGGLESLFTLLKSHEDNLSRFPGLFLGEFALDRSAKHLGKISNGSAAKRINMFLRWMVRRDEFSVDFGLWKSIKPSDLFIPLDVHTASSARALGILKRKQNDWQAVKEITSFLSRLDPADPVKYDFALFEIGLSRRNHLIESLSPA